MKGRIIIETVCADYGVLPADLGRSHIRGRVSQARRSASLRLKLAGFSITQIARMLGTSRTTIVYHLYPAKRASVTATTLRQRARAAA